MKNRPWPIVIIALFHIFAPFGNAVLHSVVKGIDMQTYFELLFSRSSGLDIFGELVLIPCAGVALLMFRKWSYPIFVGAISWATFRTAWSWYNYPNAASPFIFVSVIVLDLLLVSYFLIPAVRAAYFNRNLRWWETKARFPFEIETNVTLKDQEKSEKGKVVNISEGGIFLLFKPSLESDQELKLSFQRGEEAFELDGKIVRKMEKPASGYGVEFSHTRSTRAAIKSLLKALQADGLKPRTPPDPTFLSFKIWLKRLTTTGKGLIPEIPEAYQKKTAEDKEQVS